MSVSILPITLHETSGKFDLLTATKIANAWSRGKMLYYMDMTTVRQYFTAVKCIPDKNSPELCWVVSNRFDPRLEK